MITCSAKGCPSSQTTKIDGRPISFYAFPEDDLKNQWLHNCNLASGVNDKEPLHLCELHFERIHFTTSRDLKSSAVPTLFGRIEEPAKKHKTESMPQIKVPPLKQRKLDEPLYTTAISSENLSTERINNTEDSASGNKANISINNAAVLNGSTTLTTTGGNSDKNKEVYRLTIQIDKIRGRPGPRCKKLIPLLMHNNDIKDLAVNERELKKKIQSLQNPVKKICKQGSCKIRKCIYNSKLAFQCELCNKYYITRKEESKDSKDNSIYRTTSPGLQSSDVHAKKYFICDICQTQSNTQLMYDKHVRSHVSTDPLYPYKCHLCAEIFELKEDIKQHCSNEHPKLKTLNTVCQIIMPTKIAGQQSNYQCISCNITFSNEQAYRNHINSHKKKESLRAKINDTNVFPMSSPLSGGQIGILQPVKFSCNVCSKEFDNVGEVDVHTKTHLGDVKESYKCNICKKMYPNSAAYNEHLKQHLSRVYSCSICSKAFINKTTLKTHQKTHEL